MADNVTVIEPRKGFIPVDLREIWKYRELLYFLAWRDVKVKYKQAVIGIVWAVLQPVLTMVVFSVIFGRFAGMPSEGVPYPVFVYAGLLPWQYFAAVLTQSTSSVVSEKNLITKIYFPRIIMPASSAVSVFLDFFISALVFGAIMVYYGVKPGLGIFLVPILMSFVMMNAVGFGLWFSALNVRYRDIQYAIPFFVQIWMFVTPVIYPAGLLSEKYKMILMLNPMSGVIEAIRAAVLGHVDIPWASLAVSAVCGFAVFVSGVFYFRRVERYFSDVV
ncbi:MAG: ABC transporter permease [Deltaproteobacteria bacterium]|nr:ABC transporter permease [Deltaproteobacteria bacterium]